MANPPHPERGWLARRSHALGEVAQFVGWCVRRMIAPRRVLITLALIVAAAASPWMILRFGALGWLWSAATSAAVVLYATLLLISFLKARFSARATEVAGQVSALAADQGVRETRLRDSLSGQIGDLERRLTSLVDNRLEDIRVESAGQIQGIKALSADRLDVLRANLEGRIAAVVQGGVGVEAAVRSVEASLHSLAAATAATAERVGALDTNLRSEVAGIQADVQARLSARDGDLDRFTRDLQALVEARIAEAQARQDEAQARQDEARSTLERSMAERLEAVQRQPQAVLEMLESRRPSERPVSQTARRGLRSDIEHMFEERGQKTSEGFTYLRGLLDRRVQAGAAAVRAEIETLKDEIGARLASVENAGPAQPPPELVEEIAALQGRVAEIGDLRQQVSEALISHEASLRLVTERQEAAENIGEQLRAEISELGTTAETEVQALRASISDALNREANERAAAIQAVVAETADRHAALEIAIQTATPVLDARISELRSLMEARMGPEFEARLEAWRARLDNEIGAALQQGRSEDALAAQEREARLRSELQSLHDALLRQRDETQGLHEAVSRSMDAVRSDLEGKLDSSASEEIARAAQEAVAALRQETSARLIEQDQASREQASRIGEALEEARSAVARDAEAIEARVGSRIAEGVIARIDALKSETDAAQVIILERASSLAEARAAEKVEQVLAQTPSREELSAALEAVQTKAVEIALARSVSRDDLEAVRAAAENARSHAASREDIEAVRATAEDARKLAAEVARRAGETASRAEGAKAEDIARIEKGMKDVEARAASSAQAMRRLSDANAAIARPFDRLLANDKIQRIEQHWLKAFGINMTRTALAYMAHKICLLEDRGMGRIAAPIETIVMRQLALRSLPNRGKLEVMEIGTLFGLGAAVLYNFRGQRASGMHLTLVDPLEGYYEAGGADPVTGVEVSEATLRKNLADLDVPESDYRLIKALSSDPQAIRPASDRLYDLILVDGDHSTAGVAADFENYGPLVKPGGLMIFDDYGSEHWPGIQPYVDETPRTDPNWIWIGADYRTAILAKKADGATAKVAPKTAQKAPSSARSTPARR